MSAPEQTYPLDENGIPIKPGYRQPFNSKTAREAGLKNARLNAMAKQDARIARVVLRQVHELLSNRKRPKRESKITVDPTPQTVTKKPLPKSVLADVQKTVETVSQPVSEKPLQSQPANSGAVSEKVSDPGPSQT